MSLSFYLGLFGPDELQCKSVCVAYNLHELLSLSVIHCIKFVTYLGSTQILAGYCFGPEFLFKLLLNSVRNEFHVNNFLWCGERICTQR